MDELEHIMVDTEGFNDAGFKRAITPCTNYVQGPQTLGRQTSAQWLRVAFHDFATANVAAGTGGIDASIGFETLRPENSGSAMNDSLSFFAPYVNAHVSMADLIALSVSLSIGSCSSPTINIPLRGGRIDATEGGEFGVPEPKTDVEETLHQFAHAGFNQQDAIGLTACGHTMGNVHHGGFPQVVPESAVTPNNTGGGIHFDVTPDVFDINVVREYLAWEGQRGGALVTTGNVTVRSDLRIYTSDNNATMQDLSTSSEHFIATCISLFTRMVETVPAAVKLTDVVASLEVKPVNVTLDLTPTGELKFKGYVRLLSSDTVPNNSTVTISWNSRVGAPSKTSTASATFKALQAGRGVWGFTAYYYFDAPVDSTSGISTFFIEIDGTTHDNGGGGYPMQDVAFVVPSLSNVADDGSFSITAAVLKSFEAQNAHAVIAFPAVQLGTISPRILTSSFTLAMFNDSFNSAFSLYRASESLPLTNETNSNQVSVDLLASNTEGETVRDAFRRLKLF